MARARLQFWLLIALGFILIIAILWAALNPHQTLPPAQKLSDGRTIRVVKVLYSDHITFPLENPLTQFLPPEVSQRLHLRPKTLALGSDMVFIAIETRQTNGVISAALPTKAYMPNFATSYTGVLMSNDVGDVLSLQPTLIRYHPRGESNALVEIFETPLVSHRATNLHLRVTHLNTNLMLDRVTADFEVPNPAKRTRPLWNAGPLPMTNHVGTLDVVLESIKPGENKQVGPDYTNVMRYSTPHLKFFENGAPSTNWTVASTFVTDQDGLVLQGCYGHFSPLETRKWTFGIQRTLPVPQENILTFHNVPVPKPGEIFSPVRTNFHDGTVQITHLARNQIEFYLTPASKDCQVRMSITPAGQPHSIVDMQVDFGGGYLGFRPSIPEDVKTVDITFTIVPVITRKVEFLAHP